MRWNGDRFHWDFSVGTSDDETVRFNATAFEGYSQESPDGLNPIDSAWSIVCEALTREESLDILEFLRFYARQRRPFQIKDPDTGQWIWVDVNDWEREFSDTNARTLSINLVTTNRL